ncbi:MAG TPA: ATP-binding protein [Blastocatellia bacterium]|nr:ATP-binding protein [Blastocatellia bacterium]
MKLGEASKSFSSFRAQMVAFIGVTLVLTTIVLYLVNQRSERRITEQTEQYVQSTIQAVDLALRSTNEGKYLYKLVDPRLGGTLPVNSESIIRHILVVDSVTKEISDSTDEDDINQKLDTAIEDLPRLKAGDLKRDIGRHNDDRDHTIEFSHETEKTKRTVIIVISMKRFYRVIKAGERDRLIAIVLLGILLVGVISSFSKRFTRPITNLDQAAQRVASGELDFNVPISGSNEFKTLASTFNEMLTGLRRNRDLEEQLQRAERSAVIGRLASGIAHEIRNPLNFINLSIDHLREKFAPPVEAARSEYTHILTTIKDELSRLNRLVSNFLSYGRPAKLKLREIDARSLIEEVRSLVAVQSEEQNVKIDIHQNGDGNNRIQADAEQLKTCFSNLMINAVQAMPDGGTLEISLSPKPSEVEIAFSDTGSGITPEALGQIFEPYYSTKETGIGLGLPLTKKIIEEHGGQISVQSDPAQGTKFTLTLLREPEP